MRYLAIAAFLFSAVGCQDDARYRDGDVTAVNVMSQQLEEAMPPPDAPDVSVTFADEKTFPCLDGSVLVKVQWSYREEPYTRKYYVTWQYDECVTWQHGKIDGEARYASGNEDKGTFWYTWVSRNDKLTYSDKDDCDSYMTFAKKTQEQTRDLLLRDHCPHPVMYWWALWGMPQF